MKQKAVIAVSMFDKKSRKKALKIAVSLPGVEGVTFHGEEKKEMAITGKGFDAVLLTSQLRKRFEHAELVSYGPVEEKKKEKEAVGFWVAPQPHLGDQHNFTYHPHDPYNCSNL